MVCDCTLLLGNATLCMITSRVVLVGLPRCSLARLLVAASQFEAYPRPTLMPRVRPLGP